MFYAYAGSYLTEFVIGYTDRRFSIVPCTSFPRVLHTAAIFEDNGDGEEYANTWWEYCGWCTQDMQEVRGRVRTMGEEIVKSSWMEGVTFSGKRKAKTSKSHAGDENYQQFSIFILLLHK